MLVINGLLKTNFEAIASDSCPSTITTMLRSEPDPGARLHKIDSDDEPRAICTTGHLVDPTNTSTLL
jgi:hypothetical protein